VTPKTAKACAVGLAAADPLPEQCSGSKSPAAPHPTVCHYANIQVKKHLIFATLHTGICDFDHHVTPKTAKARWAFERPKPI
jgi:hypothetical protein